MKTHHRLLAFLALATFIGACGDDGAGPGDGDDPDYTGTWIGQASEDKGGGPFTPTLILVLSQSGTAITGTYVDSITPTYADSGSVSGTVMGDSASLTITLNDPPPITRCSGTLTGSMALENAGAQLEGWYSGNDCDFLAGGPDPNRNAVFTLDRQ